MSQALHPMLNTAIKAARSAGTIINRASLDLDLLKVNTKSPNDFVTEVDHKAEAAIIETLLGAYPGHGILAEESGRAHGAKGKELHPRILPRAAKWPSPAGNPAPRVPYSGRSP